MCHFRIGAAKQFDGRKHIPLFVVNTTTQANIRHVKQWTRNPSQYLETLSAQKV